MLGGIYGDLAASTYLRDKEVFYRQLYDEKATLSEYGLTILEQAEMCGKDHVVKSCLPFESLRQADPYARHDFVKLSDAMIEKSSSPTAMSYLNEDARVVLQFATGAWWMDDEKSEFFNINLPPNFYFEKPSGYARQFITTIITRLLNGETKDQVYEQLGPVFKSIRHNWEWKTSEGDILHYVLRAWDCFYKAFDFGSAIHNAVRCVGDIRLNATLTGMIADAMYGCGSYYVKKKYAQQDSNETFLTLSGPMKEAYRLALRVIDEQRRWRNIFFKKNNARTNVERHYFYSTPNLWEDKVISPELRRRILKAFYTSWEARFGFYLDNGWIYVYRSFVLIGRFRLKKIHDGTYRIVDTQQSDEGYELDMALNAALDTCEKYWVMESDFHFRYYSLYYGSPKDKECPYPSGSNEARFWEGERMFYASQMKNIGKWLYEGKQSLKSLNNPKLNVAARELGPESFAVAYYINALYHKWCPMEDDGWVLEYGRLK